LLVSSNYQRHCHPLASDYISNNEQHTKFALIAYNRTHTLNQIESSDQSYLP
jgi:hypothetical protein